MKRTIRLLALFNFFTDFSLLAPIAVIYFARIAGSYALAMSIFSVVMLTSAVMEVPTGIFSDRIGRKWTMIVGAFFDILFYLAIALAPSYLWLVVGGICNGIARAFYSGNNEAYLHDVLKDHGLEQEYHEYLGKTSMMFQVALALSALLGGVVAQWSFSVLLWLELLPPVIKFLLCFGLVEPQKRSHASSNIYVHFLEALRLFWRNKQLRLLSLAGMLDFAIGEAGYQFRAAFVNTLWPVWAVGLSSMLSNIGASVSFYFSGRLIKKFKDLPIILAGTLYSKAINFFSLLVPTVVSPALMSTTSLFYGSSSVAQENLLQQEFTEAQRATMGSLNSLGGSLLFAVFSLGLGLVADSLSPVKGLLLFQILSLVPLYLYIRLYRRR